MTKSRKSYPNAILLFSRELHLFEVCRFILFESTWIFAEGMYIYYIYTYCLFGLAMKLLFKCFKVYVSHNFLEFFFFLYERK